MASPPPHEQAMRLRDTPPAQRLARYDRRNGDQDGGVHATHYRRDARSYDSSAKIRWLISTVPCACWRCAARRSLFQRFRQPWRATPPSRRNWD